MPESSRAVQRILNIFCISRQSKAFLPKIFSVRKQTILVKHTIIWLFSGVSNKPVKKPADGYKPLLVLYFPTNFLTTQIYLFRRWFIVFLCLFCFLFVFFFWVMFYNWNVIFISKCSYLLQCICINYWKGRGGVTLMCPQVFALSLFWKFALYFLFLSCYSRTCPLVPWEISGYLISCIY